MKSKLRRRRSSNNPNSTSYEALESRQVLASVVGEVGTIQLTQNWVTVDLDQSFNNPVVIAGPASSFESDPLTVRVRDVTSDSFQIAIEEWEYLDGNHVSENVSYLVVEAGTHQLEDGSLLIAATHDQDQSIESISTGNLFDSNPIVFAQIMTDNDPSSVTTRVDVRGSNNFQIRFQEEQAADGIHGEETVGLVAIEPAVGSSGGLDFHTFAANGATQNGLSVSFEPDFTSTPAFFAGMQSIRGIDPATVRYTTLDNDGATIIVEEEQSADTELGHSGETAGFLVIENGPLVANDAIEGSDRFIDLEEHILGIDTMTVSELQTWANAFQSEAGSLGNRIDDFVAAVSVVELYEAEIGPLFTSQGHQSFANSWSGDNNVGRGLARAMLGVYQAVFDAVDADLIATGLVDGVFFRSTENFPGSVPNPTDPAAIYEVQIDATLHEEFGSDGGYNTNAARRMTGAYLAPGTIAEVIVPDELVNAGYEIRVGGHSWDLSNKNTANRLHRVSNTFQITDNVVRIANPMGGNIYIDVPVGVDGGIVDVEFRNTIRAPFFSYRSFDQTTQAEWEDFERHNPGAFTDIESRHSMWTVPSKWITNLGYAELVEIIEAHDAAIKVASEYVGKNPDRHKAILYSIVDTQIRANAFSIGYPQSNFGSFQQNTLREPLTLDSANDTLLWHEHGHAEFVTMFSGESESWVHMLAVAINMENYGMTAQEAFANSLDYGPSNHDTSDTLSSWVVMDEFLNGQDMAFQQGSYRPRGHADYVEYIELFGIEAMQNFNRRINIEMDGLDWDTDWNVGRTNHNANDRILRLSREAGVNVAPLFHLWGHSPSNDSALASAMAEEGLGESVQIYDRMIEARDSVPLNQAQWNAVDSVMRAFLNESRGPWAELRANYDVARGQAAVDRIQELIDQYFPNGRPDAPVGEPIAATVTAFSDSNYSGTPWQLAEGTYVNVDLDAGPIGNDAISSFLIPDGYEVTVYQWSGGTGNTATYTGSVATLDLLDDDVSRVEVRSTLDSHVAFGESDSISLDEQWKTVTLDRTYNDPVVIAGTPSHNGTDPSTVRIRNVTNNSFEIQIDEWDYLDPTHAVEVVSYMVVEAGTYQLDDGTTIVAGNRAGQDNVWQSYDLGSIFDGLGTPVVLANVVTTNDPSAVTTRVEVLSDSEFQVRIQEEDAADRVHGDETISYFAVQATAGATGGLHYDAGTFAANHQGQFENFGPGVSFSSVTSFFAAMQSFVGSDATTLRNTVLNAAGVTVFTEEERSADNEVGHSDETIGYFAINPGLIRGIELVAPEVEVIEVNSGSNQRSVVRDISVSFSEEVNVDSGDFQIENLDSGVSFQPDVATQIVDGKTIATLTFSGSNIVGDSLPDGNYRLTVLNTITDLAGNQLDGNGDGESGDNATDEFFRLYGDLSGDGNVNVIDLLQFRNAFNSSDGDANFNTNADFGNDGFVSVQDLLQFRNRFGTSV